ncbi:uncharacterized protein LOC126179242 [Schistocerca cancellata]|uniref:uncharacterized protein LOC126179242 n=1 Tax=Schistocerca cancellata TaxID=274614 RepID=UPI00211924F6|nr:uncharacterized protein LOC126179242 [Schistocerca cancellata]
MEAGGFRVRLDLSQFFSDIKKFSCVYVDLSRDRQIADVVDRISEVFGIERPLSLLDERFYLPESENVNVLRNSNVVKVLKAFHFHGRESCSTTDHLTKSNKEVEYLGQEIHPEQESRKNNKTDSSENFDSQDLYQNEKINNSCVSHIGKASFHEARGKKRKREEIDKSKFTNSVNVLQQDLEPEIHYQKKCKRKKERVKKEVLNGGSIEPLQDELEKKNSDGIRFDNKANRKKKRNKAVEINGDVTEDKVVSEVVCHNSPENISDHDEQETAKGLKKHKKKRKSDLASLDAHKSLDSEHLHPTDLKKRNKKLNQSDAETDVAQDQSLSLSCEFTSDTTFLTSCSKGAQKCKNGSSLTCQNIDGVVNSGIEDCDSKDYGGSDFVDRAVSSTPNFIGGCKIREVADFLSQDSTSIYDSALGNHLDNVTNTTIGTKPKRKRVRVRKHRKRNGIQNDSVVALPSVVVQHTVPQYSIPPRKHIRFDDAMGENLKESTSNKEVPLSNDMDMRNNTTEETCDSKASPNVNDESTHDLTPETEVTDCPTKNSFEYCTPENCIIKSDSTSLPNQIPLHQQWALNTADLNMNTKESLQKLLILGKQNSVPVVFERKSQCNSSGSASESLMPVSKQNSNKNSEGTSDFQSTQVVDQADMTCLKMNPYAIDPLHYPQLEGKPKKNDIIAFKKLKMTSNYTPEVSGFIIATVLNISEDTLEMSLRIEAGESDLEAPKGRFYLENEDSEKNENDSKLHQLNWNELMDVRILFP